MTTVTAEVRQLSDQQLADLWSAGGIGLPALEAECRRREQADRAKARDMANRAAWLDAAHAQYLQADRDCRGHLFKPAYRDSGPADAMSLWRGSEAFARKYASEELCEWWDAHGGRLSLARWRRDQAIQARADRDARDLAAMAATPVPSARELAELAARAPRTAGIAPGVMARFTARLRQIELQADRTARALARVNGGMPR